MQILRSSSHVRLSIEIHICTPILKRGKAAIVDYIDHDEALTFMAVKWMEGGTLEQQRQKKPFTHREVEMIFHDALDALAYIHSKALESLPNDTNGGILDLTVSFALDWHHMISRCLPSSTKQKDYEAVRAAIHRGHGIKPRRRADCPRTRAEGARVHRDTPAIRAGC